MTPNIYNTGYVAPVSYMAPMARTAPAFPATPTSPVRAYSPSPVNRSFKMNFIQPSTVGQITTPRHTGNFQYGFNGQINFYDPLTGRQGPTVNTLPQVQTMVNRPSGLNMSLVGNSSDVSKISKMIAEANDYDDDDDEYFEFTEANLKKMQEKIKSQKNQKKISIQNKIHNNNKDDNDNDDDDAELVDFTESNLKRLLGKIRQSKNIQEYEEEDAEDKMILKGGQIFVQNVVPTVVPTVVSNSSWKLIGDLLVHSSLTTTYSGSGVLLFDKFEQNNVELLTVIMGQESNGEFSDFGGVISTFQPNSIENSLAENAKQKIYEKSCSSFFIQSNIYNFYKAEITHDKDNSLYRCYLIGIHGDIKHCNNDDLTSILNSNRRIYKKYGQITPDMHAIKSIARFDLRLLLRAVKGSRTKISVLDIDGNSRVLSNRVVKILKHLINNMRAYNSIYTDMLRTTLTSANKINTLVIN
jgi:hypothetical protein